MALNNLLADFEALTNRLAQEGPASSVDFLLEQMEPESAGHLRLCAIPHQFDLEIMQALDPNLDKGKAKLYCEEFGKLPVITFNHDGMALHDKARQHLFQQWLAAPGNPAFRAANERLVKYFESRARTFKTWDSALNVIRVSWVFHLLGANQEKGFSEFEKLCRLKRRQFALSDCEQIINLAHEYDAVLSPRNAAWLTYHEGKLAADRCQWELAEDLFNRLLENGALDPELQVRVQNRLGMIRDENRDYATAIKYYQKALELASAVPDNPRITYRILHDLGAAYRDSGNLEMAEKLLTESIKRAEANDDWSAMAVASNSLGTLYRRQKENWKSIKAFENSLRYLANSGDTYRPAQVYNNLGISYRELSDWRKSKEYFEKSLAITIQVGDKFGQAKALNNLMTVYRNLKDNAEAIRAAEFAIKIFAEIHDTFNLALTKRNLGRVYRRMNKREAAAAAFDGAIEAFEQCREIREAENTRRDREELFRKKRNPGFWIALIAIVILIILALYKSC